MTRTGRVGKLGTTRRHEMKNPKVDHEGFHYETEDGFSFRVTDCCGEAASVDEFGTVYCKGCYEAVDPRMGMEPILSGDSM